MEATLLVCSEFYWSFVVCFALGDQYNCLICTPLGLDLVCLDLFFMKWCSNVLFKMVWESRFLFSMSTTHPHLYLNIHRVHLINYCFRRQLHGAFFLDKKIPAFHCKGKRKFHENIGRMKAILSKQAQHPVEAKTPKRDTSPTREQEQSHKETHHTCKEHEKCTS